MLEDKAPLAADVQRGPVSAEPSPQTESEGSASGQYCANCKALVVGIGRGLCPTCGRFLPEHTVSITTGLRSKRLAKIVDAYRVSLIEQLFAERGGRAALDVVSRIAIENYALVCAQHKTIETRLDQDGLFTQTGRRRSAFDMLKGISETIDRLRAQLPPVPARSDAIIDNPYGDLTDAQLLSRLDRVRSALTAQTQPPAAAQVIPHADTEPSTTSNIAAPVTSPCDHCGLSPTACAALKAERFEIWRRIHANIPEVGQALSDEADARLTNEMFEGIERRTRGEDR